MLRLKTHRSLNAQDHVSFYRSAGIVGLISGKHWWVVSWRVSSAGWLCLLLWFCRSTRQFSTKCFPFSLDQWVSMDTLVSRKGKHTESLKALKVSKGLGSVLSHGHCYPYSGQSKSQADYGPWGWKRTFHILWEELHSHRVKSIMAKATITIRRQ